MVQITVTDELAQAIAEAGPLVTLVDSRGRTVGQIVPLHSVAAVPIGMTDEHLEELKRRMKNDDGTRYTWAEVQERLRNAEQIEADVVLALQRKEEAKRGGTFYTTDEVLEHLQASE
jgi:hypothetical protein